MIAVRAAALTFMIWMAGVIIALALTLQPLSKDEFDGLNNLLQLPLALPWGVLVPANPSHAVQAWIDAGWGTLNGALLAVLVGAVCGRRTRSLRN